VGDRRRLEVAGWAAALTLAGCTAGPLQTKEPDMANERRTAGCASASDVTRRAWRAAGESAGDTSWELTPPFPASWPPPGDATAVFYAYGRVMQETGVPSWEVQSPFLRVEVPLGDESAPPRVVRLDPRPLRPFERASPADAVDPLESAQTALIDTLCSQVLPDGPAAATLRGAYLRWTREHRALTAELRPSCAAFFDWLETEA
jgi:hypothetical protein